MNKEYLEHQSDMTWTKAYLRFSNFEAMWNEWKVNRKNKYAAQ